MKEQMNFEIDSELKNSLKDKAKIVGRSMSAHLIHLIKRDLGVIEIPVYGKVEGDKVVLDSDYAKYINGTDPCDPRD